MHPAGRLRPNQAACGCTYSGIRVNGLVRFRRPRGKRYRNGLNMLSPNQKSLAGGIDVLQKSNPPDHAESRRRPYVRTHIIIQGRGQSTNGKRRFISVSQVNCLTPDVAKETSVCKNSHVIIQGRGQSTNLKRRHNCVSRKKKLNSGLIN